MNRILTLMFILTAVVGYGQKNKMSFERLKALKMSFIAEKIGLMEEEESIFWEIYDQYEKEIFVTCRKEIKNIRKNNSSSVDDISDEEAIEIIKKINELESHAIKLRMERDKHLLEKFSAQMILKMHQAEYRFNREMVYKIKKDK